MKRLSLPWLILAAGHAEQETAADLRMQESQHCGAFLLHLHSGNSKKHPQSVRSCAKAFDLSARAKTR